VTNAEFKEELEQRTKRFAVALVNWLDTLPERRTVNVLVYQLAKSGTAMGANYREANKAESKDDFLYKPAARGSGRKRMGNWNAQVIGRDGSPSRPRRFRRNRPTGFNTALVRQNIQVIGKISIVEKESNTVFQHLPFIPTLKTLTLINSRIAKRTTCLLSCLSSRNALIN